MKLDDIKKSYSGFEKEYKLPSFRQLNEEFEIFKAGKDKDCLLRSIRKIIMDKVVNALGFLEMLLNAMNVPRMYMPYLKVMTNEDKKIIEDIYGKFAELSLLSLEREIEYSEKAEAELIKNLYHAWNSVKPDFKKILGHIKNPNTDISRKEKSYFG